jgi:hypothetical protein
MRVFLGMILGAALTVAGAYMYDSVATGPAVTTAPGVKEQRTMVNWDVVGRNWRDVQARLRQSWTKISSLTVK